MVGGNFPVEKLAGGLAGWYDIVLAAPSRVCPTTRRHAMTEHGQRNQHALAQAVVRRRPAPRRVDRVGSRSPSA
jgi:hypothetical protein